MESFDREKLLQKLHQSADASVNDIDDMKELIGLLPAMRTYIDTTPQYDPDRRFVLDCCCDIMEFVYSHTKNNDTLMNLNAVVRMNHKRLESTPEDNPAEYAEALINLSNVLERRFSKRGNPNPWDDLDRAIDASQQAVALSLDHPNHFEWLRKLGELLRKRSDQKSSIDDIRMAIQNIEKAIEEAIENPPKDDDDLGSCFDSYGKALRAKFELTTSFIDLEAAIDAHRRAVEYKSGNEGHQGGKLSNLGNALLQHFGRTHSMDELNRAIHVLDEGVKCTPDGHHELPARTNNLSNAYLCRFDYTGVIADLNMCIQLNSKAVSIARATKGHSDLPECLIILGENLQILSKRMGSKEDLEEAIRVLTEAEPLLLKDNPQRAICLSSLGSAFVTRSDRTKSLHPQQSKDDLDQGIKFQREAAQLTSDQNPNWPIYMTKLGNALSARFRKGDTTEEVDACVKAHEAATKKNRQDPLFHGLSLVNYGNALILRFQITEDIKDLDSAIKAHDDALRITPEGHPYVAVYEDNLGSCFAKRFHHSQNPEDMKAAIDHHEKAFLVLSATPSLRIGAARDAARLRLRRRQIEAEDIKQATRLLKEAIELLPRTSPISLQRSDQQDALARFAGLASNAAALTLHSNGTAFEALRLLELGRGVMASLQLDARTDISFLTGVDSQLADQFRDLRDQLDSPQLDGASNLYSATAPIHRTVSLPERHTVLEKLNEIVEKIRIEGHPNFLKGPTEEEFTSLAKNGPIVVFNVDINRSDVFLVTRDGIKALKLPKLRYEDVKTMAKQSRRVVNAREAVMRKGTIPDDTDESSTMDEVLQWLWDAAIGQILTELKSSNALDPPKNGDLPHVWWITSGWLSILPIHAAGCHANGSTENALDLVISSYAPTIKSLRYARDKEMRISNEPCKHALLVSMKETDGQNPLPGAEKEVNTLNSVLPTSIRRTVRRGAAKDAIMPALGDCHVCHFACHGESHPADPSLSRLLLADWKSNPLSVNDIVALKPKHAKLAYLSACSAADSRVEALLDESIHLMSAFLLAGYPSVVGTLWQIRDLLSVEVATLFYGSICEKNQGMDVKQSASALNKAIRHIRDRLGTEFDSSCVWAPYIHIGV